MAFVLLLGLLLLTAATGRSLESVQGRCVADNATINSIFASATFVTLPTRNLTLNVATRVVHNDLPPLVFIHGILGSLHVWQPFLTEPGMRHLICKRTVVLLDLRGFGDSQKDVPSSQYRVREFALDIIALLDALHLDRPAVFLGHSLGGYITQEIALSFPERTSKVVIFAVGASSAYFSRPAVQGILQALASFTDELPPAFLNALVDGFYVVPPIPSYRAILIEAAFKATLDAVRVTLNETVDFTGRLPSLRKPTFLAFGGADPLVPPEYRGELSQLICGSTTVTLGFADPPYGHYVFQEAAPQLSRALPDFLQSSTFVCKDF